MAAESTTGAGAGGGDLRSRVTDWLTEAPVWQLLAVITVLSLILRLVFLGDRMAHYDEGRVAYWSVYYQETGAIAYRHIVHGPLVQHVNRWVFAVLPPSDFTMRLFPATVGALLPLTAYLFRKHLRRVEMVGMGLLLAINPVMLYYSRFMRSDVLVAAFMFVSFGFLVRYWDTRKLLYFYPATIFAALGFASKENAVIYVVTWVGAAAVVLTHERVRKRPARWGAVVLLVLNPVTVGVVMVLSAIGIVTFLATGLPLLSWLLGNVIGALRFGYSAYVFAVPFLMVAGGYVFRAFERFETRGLHSFLGYVFRTFQRFEPRDVLSVNEYVSRSFERFEPRDLLSVPGYVIRAFKRFVPRDLFPVPAYVALGITFQLDFLLFLAVAAVVATIVLADGRYLRPDSHNYLRSAQREWDWIVAKATAHRRWEPIERQRVQTRVVDYLFHGMFAFVAFAIVLLFFYAPRGEGLMIIKPSESAAPIPFWQILSNPVEGFELISYTRDRIVSGFQTWFGKGGVEGGGAVGFKWSEYRGNAGLFWQVMVSKGAPLFALGIVGLLIQWFRYVDSHLGLVGKYETAGAPIRPRSLVVFAGYCGVASIVGYPQGMDIAAGWVVVHALVPLSIPAGVAFGKIVDWGREARAAGDDIGVGAATLVVGAVLAFAIVTAGTSVYANYQTHENPMVQYAQPSTNMHPELQRMAAIADEHESGPDLVVYYGEQGSSFDSGDSLVKQNPATWDDYYVDLRPRCVRLISGGPIHWYLYKDDIQTTCERQRAGLLNRTNGSAPPVVITQPPDSTVPRPTLSRAYESHSHRLRAHPSPVQQRQITIWIHRNWTTAG